MQVAVFDETPRGGRKLRMDGFTFTLNRQIKHVGSWKCTRYKPFKCRARAITRVHNGVELCKATRMYHTHGPEYALNARKVIDL